MEIIMKKLKKKKQENEEGVNIYIKQMNI